MKKLFTIRNIHIVSALTIMCVFIVAAVAFIQHDAAFINVMGLGDKSIGRCFYRDHFGITCPSCGLTRSFISIENFRFSDAFRYNRVGIFIYILFLLTFIFNLMGIFKLKIVGFVGKIVAVYATVVSIVLVMSWLVDYFWGI